MTPQLFMAISCLLGGLVIAVAAIAVVDRASHQRRWRYWATGIAGYALGAVAIGVLYSTTWMWPSP